MPSVRSRRRRAGPPPLAPGAGARLPTLCAVAPKIELDVQSQMILGAAVSMAEAGLARPGDWDAFRGDGPPSPYKLITNALHRLGTRCTAPMAQQLDLTLNFLPFTELAGQLFEDPEEPPGSTWVFNLESFTTIRIPVGELVKVLEPAATGVAIHGLTTHTPLYVGSGEDLEWIVDGWEPDGSEPEILKKHNAAMAETAKISALWRNVRPADAAVLASMPLRLRRALFALRAYRLPKWERPSAWDRLQDAEWSMPMPIIQLIWTAGTGLDHAADEAEHFYEQGDGTPHRPQQMWLIDVSNAQHAREDWTYTRTLLRNIRASMRVVRELLALCPTP